MARKKRKAKEKLSALLTAMFWALVGVGALIISVMLFPDFRSCMRLYFLPLLGIFFLLGIILLFLAIRQKNMNKKLRKFLILTGASAVGFFVFSVLHNLFYALGVLTDSILVLQPVLELLHVASFLIAIFVCPIGFLVGVAGSIVMFVRKRK